MAEEFVYSFYIVYYQLVLVVFVSLVDIFYSRQFISIWKPYLFHPIRLFLYPRGVISHKRRIEDSSFDRYTSKPGVNKRYRVVRVLSVFCIVLESCLRMAQDSVASDIHDSLYLAVTCWCRIVLACLIRDNVTKRHPTSNFPATIHIDDDQDIPKTTNQFLRALENQFL